MHACCHKACALARPLQQQQGAHVPSAAAAPRVLQNVDNIKGCIMSILNSKIREDRNRRQQQQH